MRNSQVRKVVSCFILCFVRSYLKTCGSAGIGNHNGVLSGIDVNFGKLAIILQQGCKRSGSFNCIESEDFSDSSYFSSSLFGLEIADSISATKKKRKKKDQ
jgi:hypothetical protein